MTTTQAPEVKVRCVALFPGAFRPPHLNHLATLETLRADPRVDEVVIIVSGRMRPIPGTDLALGPEASVAVWDQYLHGIDDVRVEIAESSAVAHAEQLVDAAAPGTHHLLCTGVKDFGSGKGRFSKLLSRRLGRGVTVESVAGASDVVAARSSDLRSALGAGDAGRHCFDALLPASLNCASRQRVWEICRSSMIDHQVAQQRAVMEHHQRIAGPVVAVAPTVPGKVDQVWRADLGDGTSHFVKFAGDTVSDVGAVGNDLKPRARIKAERHALKWIQSCGIDVVTPEVVGYDRGAKVLITSGLHGESLEHQMARGTFDAPAMASAARLLGFAHSCRDRPPYFRDSEEHDRDHFAQVIDEVFADAARAAPDFLLGVLGRTRTECHEAAERRFVFLDRPSAKILVGRDPLGWLDFERACSFGDSAIDVGMFFADCLRCGLGSGEANEVSSGVDAAVLAYRDAVGDEWLEMSDRVLGCAIVGLLTAPRVAPGRSLGDESLVAITSSLAASIGSEEPIETSFRRAMPAGPATA